LDRPLVSILIPCYQEEKTIGRLLAAIRAQTFPLDRMEVLVADGFSTDRTREMIELFNRTLPELDVRILDNPKRIIPAALNLCIQASQGEILLRLDGHSLPSPDYVSTCVRLLADGKGDMVGGVWHVEPGDDSWQARSIAAAASHPVGVGDAYYRWAITAREVDTLAFWAFSKAWIDRVGLFDETLRSNEDYDFNSRFRAAGGRIWLDPSVACVYYARSRFGALTRQYLRYGFWKGEVARRSPRTLRWRQVLPPMALLASILLGALGLWNPAYLEVFLGVVLAYLLMLFGVGVQQASKRMDPMLVLGVPLAICTMHLSWAGAFLWSFPAAFLARRHA